MLYALVIGNTIQSVGGLPAAAQRLDTGEWISPPNREWTDEQAALCGYLPVTDTPRPDDDALGTHDRTVDLVAGVPTVVWTYRPWTADELHAREVAALRMEQEAALAALTPTQTDALLDATAPPAGSPWRQPSGAFDAYPTGAIVTHNDQTWESTTTANVWEPGISGWQVSGVEWPDWVQPTGAHDAYPQGAKVTHNTQHWISDIDANVYEPGVYGWTAQP